VSARSSGGARTGPTPGGPEGLGADELRDLREALEDARRTLEGSRRQLEEAERLAALGQLTAGVAHEIKNPLNFVNNFARVAADLASELQESVDRALAEKDADAAEDVRAVLVDLQAALERIQEHGRRADAIVGSMMQYVRSDDAGAELLDLNRLVGDCCDLARLGSGALSVDIHRALDADLPQMLVDPQGMSRIIVNLLNNAFYALGDRASREEAGFSPALQVSTRMIPGPRCEIRVADNGGGIPAAVVGRIFEPFFTTKAAGSGTGLGLSLSRELAEEWGGSLDVENRPGEGAEFILLIPVRTS
jgi:signal transduction histidine kinase